MNLITNVFTLLYTENNLERSEKSGYVRRYLSCQKLIYLNQINTCLVFAIL